MGRGRAARRVLPFFPDAVVAGQQAHHPECCGQAAAAGATRIKRLRDTLGNQLVSQLLIKNIARRGYLLAIEKDVIRMV